MSSKEQNAISPTRAENYPEWYQQVVKAADLADVSPVRGCMIIKPWGYGIWENLQKRLDFMIKETGHENAYFPLFIPISFLEKEATHVEGFAKECAVVTHHRLETKDGKLVPAGELDEPLIVRPTSETIIGDAFSKWITSYRDLPVLINQWANVVRWEMRTRVFLRTTEFLWQEGHTAHADEAEARAEVDKMLDVYTELCENTLALPVIKGRKSEGERFPGAVDTLCIEAMMQDRKALQAGTSHYLGQNFAKASGIRFLNQQGVQEYAHTTSWGVSTRLIGGMIMAHSDDDGLRVPPRLAQKQIVILPVIPNEESKAAVMEYAEKLKKLLTKCQFDGASVTVQLDARDLRGGEKSWQWIKKGIPLRIEVGPRDLENNKCVLTRRDRPHKEKTFLTLEELAEQVPQILAEIQQTYFDQAKAYLEQNIRRDILDWESMKAFFTPKNSDNPEIHGGFVLAKWCGDSVEEEKLKELKITIRCYPLEQSGTPGKCVVTGRESTIDAIFAKAY